jgi:hypothetical protein
LLALGGAWYFASVPLPASASAAPAPNPAATEVVKRPDPGLARGVWEAPQWLFWMVGLVAVVLAVGYALVRLGVLKRRVKRRT